MCVEGLLLPEFDFDVHFLGVGGLGIWMMDALAVMDL